MEKVQLFRVSRPKGQLSLLDLRHRLWSKAMALPLPFHPLLHKKGDKIKGWWLLFLHQLGLCGPIPHGCLFIDMEGLA